jgi:hypothetical protein
MPWKTRKHREYYYRSVRDAWSVRTEYFGTGPLADFAAAEDAQRQVSREIRAALEFELAAFEAAFREPLSELAEHVDLLVKAVLYSRGYHRHDRGSWRKRRGG